MVRKRSEHYVNNKEFLAAIVEYKYLIQLAEQKGEPRPVIPRYLGECFMKIARHLSSAASDVYKRQDYEY